MTKTTFLSRSWLAVNIQKHHLHQSPQPFRGQIRTFSKKPKTSSRQWLDRHVNDPFVKKAQDNGKVSRSYYKLEFMDQKYGLFKSAISNTTTTPPLPHDDDDDKSKQDKKMTQVVVDLGAAPGGWTQYASEQQQQQQRRNGTTNENNLCVLAIDLLELDAKVANLPNVHFLQGDFTKLVIPDHLSMMMDSANGSLTSSVRIVMSDMAPNFIGDSRSDTIRTADLCEQALEFSFTVLEPGGVFVGKYFSGPEEKELKEMALEEFTKVVTVKPPASRNESSERYLVALGRR